MTEIEHHAITVDAPRGFPLPRHRIVEVNETDSASGFVVIVCACRHSVTWRGPERRFFALAAMHAHMLGREP